MRLIDADRLLKHTKYYNLPNGNRAIDEIDILHAPTVQAIPLDKVKQAREEIDDLDRHYDNDYFSSNRDAMFKCNEVLEILDKLLESEG